MNIKMSSTEDGKVVVGLVLDQEDADILTNYLFDGYCKLCGVGISHGTHVCCGCLDEEIDAHRSTHIHESFNDDSQASGWRRRS